jgi:hypothetical protein
MNKEHNYLLLITDLHFWNFGCDHILTTFTKDSLMKVLIEFNDENLSDNPDENMGLDGIELQDLCTSLWKQLQKKPFFAYTDEIYDDDPERVINFERIEIQ